MTMIADAREAATTIHGASPMKVNVQYDCGHTDVLPEIEAAPMADSEDRDRFYDGQTDTLILPIERCPDCHLTERRDESTFVLDHFLRPAA